MARLALSSIIFVVSIISAFIFEEVTMPGYDTLAIIGSVFYIVTITTLAMNRSRYRCQVSER